MGLGHANIQLQEGSERIFDSWSFVTGSEPEP